jgi:hypothetical protein
VLPPTIPFPYTNTKLILYPRHDIFYVSNSALLGAR